MSRPHAGNPQFANVTVNGNFTVGTLGISAGDQVTVANTFDLNVASLITNAGTILINSTGANTGLQGSFHFTGGGVVQLSGADARPGTGVGSITNVNNLIRGQGSIGGNNTDRVNQATINADVNGGSIFIDPRSTATAFTNAGTLTASSGGGPPAGARRG